MGPSQMVQTPPYPSGAESAFVLMLFAGRQRPVRNDLALKVTRYRA